MATGRDMQLTRQVGRYLAAAEICRRGLNATTLSQTVPHCDIIVSNATGRDQAIQVKAIKSSAWQFDLRDFAAITLEGKRQVIGRLRKAPCPDLLCILVRLQRYGADEFYILTWRDLQKIAIDSHRAYLASHGGIRPKKHDSFHTAIRPEMVTEHRDKWEILHERLRNGV